jgi:2-phospho-L-lactate guanylyltransferase
LNLQALVPLKSIAHGKQRLAAALSAEDRHRLIKTMLVNVITALRETPDISGVNIVTGETNLPIKGCARIDDKGFGLNSALSDATRFLSAKGVDTLLVVPADLPFVTSGDIQALIDAARHSDVVVAPDLAWTCTNGLVVSPPEAIRPRFGLGSRLAHVAAAQAAGRSVTCIDRGGLALDIDEPADLETLITRGGWRYEFLSRVIRRAS